MSNNNHVPWGTPKEINRDAMPDRPLANQSPFEPLYADIVARLEQTNGNKALVYPFKDRKALKSARYSLANLFGRRVGKKSVVVTEGIMLDGTPALYVARGPNYK